MKGGVGVSVKSLNIKILISAIVFLCFFRSVFVFAEYGVAAMTSDGDISQYTEKTAEPAFISENASDVHIYIAAEPVKKTYTSDESFTSEGGVLNIVYGDGRVESVSVTDDMCSGYDLSKPGRQTVIISFEGYEFTYAVTVIGNVNPELGDVVEYSTIVVVILALCFVIQVAVLHKKCEE